jgi:outer membrane protein assembly factor BamA
MYYLVRKSFAKNELNYFTNYLDWRSYYFFEKRYSLAFRFNAGISSGETPEMFSLDGLYGVRALNEDVDGKKMILGSAELRFPLVDYLGLAFPIPLSIRNIRGSIFTDIGSAWDNNSDFQASVDGKLKDIKLGYGFGPRINLGYFVLKFDISWLTDLSHISKPMLLLSLTEDF